MRQRKRRRWQVWFVHLAASRWQQCRLYSCDIVAAERKDYYQILGVDRDASPRDIKQV